MPDKAGDTDIFYVSIITPEILKSNCIEILNLTIMPVVR